MEKRGVKADKMNPHGSIQNCRMFLPLTNLTDNDVWMVLLQSKPPWGGTHRNLVSIYRSAGGGECPLVLTKEDASSCGTTSPRFGCWTCTVISKDRSLEGLEPLYDFHKWLLNLRENDDNRISYRRDGTAKYRNDGSRVRGPFKMAVRRQILEKLYQLEKETDRTLMTKAELRFIESIWRQDEARYECRTVLLSMIGASPAVWGNHA